MKEVDSENKASTTISAKSRGHKGRLDHSYIKNYPAIAKKRLEDVKNMQAQELLQKKPSQSRDNIPLHLQIKEEEKAENKKKIAENKKKFDDALLAIQ